MISRIASRYDAFYGQRDPKYVYPVEFVVRAFLGSYPRLRNNNLACAGATVLDLGFGDGRNMPLFANLGMAVYGVEVSDEICRRTAERMRRLGLTVQTKVGWNHQIPFDTGFFDHVVACHSCYYVAPGTTFADNVREIARVMKPSGRFVFSAPMGSTYILNGARDLGDGHMEITQDPYKVRNGSVLKKFDRAGEIDASLDEWFDEFSIGSCRNDFWGIEEHVWVVVCRRR
jgi:SAM-dependent methyltransferase